MLVFLVGFMGVGKTTLGKKLATKLNFSFIDLDQFIEKEQNKSIETIFETKGEAYFRKLELETLTGLFQLKDHVISLGGGTPCFNDIMPLLKQHGISIYIQANAAFIESRLKNSKQNRPLIKYLKQDSLLPYIESKLNERTQFYTQADIIADVLSVDVDTLALIIKDMQHRFQR